MKRFFILTTFAFIFASCTLVKDIAFPPEDYGNPDVFKGVTPGIVLFPFSVISNVDGNWEDTNYYTTNEISLWIYFRIRDKCNVIYPDSSNHYFADTTSQSIPSMLEFKHNLISSILSNPDSVKYWKSNVNNNPLSSDTYFYLPLCIEKERNHKVSGSFFTLIADSKGQILFIRKIEYNPIMWSEDYRYFRDDTRNKMPLAKWGI